MMGFSVSVEAPSRTWSSTKYQFQVLKRMQEVLKQLMLEGLSWQDDITQSILSKELKRVPHTTLPSKPNSSSSSHHSSQSKHYTPHHQSSKQGSPPPGGKYLDYMIVEPPQAQMHMQAAALDPYTYQQHRYQDEVERSLMAAGGGYARPPSRYQPGQRERERDRQLLQQALSLYLASAQPSHRHRGAASMAPAGLPYYEDFELEMPVDVEDYTLEKKLNTAGLHQSLPSRKTSQDFNPRSGSSDDLLQRMSLVLQRYNIDPRELSQEQLYKLAVILQLVQGQEKTDPTEKDLIAIKELQLLKKQSVSKPEKTLHLDSPQHLFSASIPASPPPKSPGSPPSPPQVPPEHHFKEPVVEGAGAKEEYGYIYTNRSPLSLYDGVKLLELLADKIHLTTSSFINISVIGPALTFRIRQNEHNMTAAEVAAKAVSEKNFLESETGLKIVQTGVGERTDARGLPQVAKVPQESNGTVITLVSMAVVGGVLVLAIAVALFQALFSSCGQWQAWFGSRGRSRNPL
ncbi:Receptor-type tyrosine-protein phosphatase-like N [Oryzias melastigma]|uniref:Receptor-type tyrosine-protein phosphatase-like N n=1 Tax=Oryzias melastigma TaxID=30732 RepID=A0A834EYM8_ORYME|nr:Receptor-type tyrosine-protein phosphatase-like N [Oryzias melastigma]